MYTNSSEDRREAFMKTFQLISGTYKMREVVANFSNKSKVSQIAFGALFLLLSACCGCPW